ncbi:SDR family NAD(P)-dependent oxidoreductase [Streptomyces sp. C1-2]|uniref:SDR family NAD(P)-dependent oxidoreductase n=1 Tax=Streptomyces sp. C1-2 TaxID=2720022 RepID=UPI00143237B6|nr:SDR family NAD(P)-dependent oxidoreductase [Streptomyces sp. C1-2]NJP75475.1 SDR family NAD(P)-dependent oxidoreductase [Streptomyces sp. C1-2]
MGTWLITGATSGFGRCTADRAIAAGHHVLAVGRRAELLEALAAAAPEGTVTTIALDLTAAGAETTLATAVDATGGLDVVVNNAGYGLFTAIEDTTADVAKRMIDTNFLANLSVLRATLPALRASRGRVIQVSSYVGSYAWASSGVYSASKAAVELASDALAQELAPVGVHVTLVQPGLFGTEFTASAEIVAPSEPYLPTVGAFFEQFSALPASAYGNPADVADIILAVGTMNEPPLRYPVGQDAVDAIRAGLQSRLAELEKWAGVNLVEQG